MHKEHNYRARTVWTGVSHGTTPSYDAYSREYTVTIEGKPPFKGSADSTFRGDPSLHNPEDLLVIALSACHMLTYLSECARSGIGVLSYEDEATGTMIFKGKTFQFSEVVLHPKVVIRASDNLEKALEFHHRSHELCFIAQSVAFPVRNKPVVVVDGHSE